MFNLSSVLRAPGDQSAYSWFQSNLSNRSQCVTYDGVKSSLGSIKCGVPDTILYVCKPEIVL